MASAWKGLMVVMVAMGMALTSTPGEASADGVTIPGAPTGVTAVASDSVATVWFAAPSSNGGSVITGYTVTAVDTTMPANGGQTCTSSDPSDSCVVLNLTDSDHYTFQVVATNAVGSSSSSSSNSVVPAVVTVTQVSSGSYAPSTCARLSNGTAACWGLNSNGQLGNATTTPSLTPAQVVGVGGVGLLTGVASVTVGTDHACAVLDSGSVDCWGNNSSGQLGTNSTTSSNVPVQVFDVGSTSSSSLLAGVTSVSAGEYGTCAMLSVGGVDCWGYNGFGELGNNSTTDSWTPVQVFAVGSSSASALLTGVASISMGRYHACALLSSGSVDCWGVNSYGQLGDNSTTDHAIPVQVMGVGAVGLLSGVTSVSLGDVQTCVSLSNGGADCWGYDNWGQLGDGQKHSVSTLAPAPVLGVGGVGFLADVATLTSAASHNCAVLMTGAVDCWGQGNNGQLGNNATLNSNTPVQVFAVGSTSVASLLAGVSSLALGDNFACALSATGTVACWGAGVSGRLGDGVTTSSSTPVAIVAGSPTSPSVLSLGSQSATMGWTASAEGVWYQATATDVTTPANGGQTCAKTRSTSCTVTGLINGDTYTFSVVAYNGLLRATSVPTAPIAIANAPTGVPTAAGYDRAAMVSFATALPTGSYTATATDLTNPSRGGQTASSSMSPIAVGGLTNGDSYAFTVTSTDVFGTSAPSAASNTVTPSAIKVAQIGSGASARHTCVVLSNGTVSCWGDNGFGDLGNGTTTDSTTPVPVKDIGGTGLLSNVSSVAVGLSHTCALLTTGAVDCWGLNSSGQLGNNATTASSIPVPVFAVGSTSSASLLSGVTAIAAGANHNCALLATGNVDCWGGNSSGQIGNNATAVAKTPTQVFAVGSTSSASLLSSVSAITAGSGHSCALLATGHVDCWGLNSSGQLGNNSPTSAKTPVEVFAVGSTSIASQLVDVASVAAGYANTCVVLISGGLDCWGGNSSGQLGNNSPTTAKTPVQVFAADSPTGSSFFTSAASVATENLYECALLTTGKVDCWGDNAYGGLGINSTTAANLPTELTVAPSSPVVSHVSSHASTISWTAAPTSTYYSTVTATDVTTPANGGETCAATTTSTSCTVLGLTDGDSYTFAVTAFSGIGTSAPSASSSPTVFAIAPGSPTSLVGTPGDGSVSLSFTAPASHGSAITGYTVTSYDVTTSTSAASQSCSSPGCVISGLTNGDRYSFTMTATNAEGTGAPSLPSTAVTPVSHPGAPTNVSGGVDHGRSLVSWLPASSNGSPVISYTASVVGDATLSCTYTVPVSGPEADECSITGLADATTYTFQVVASNAVGAGPSGTSSSVTTAGAPGAPTITATSADIHHVTLTWTDGATNGAAIASWTVRVYAGASLTPLVVVTDCTGSPCTIAGLSPATSYTLTVTDTNAVGEGSASNQWAISTVAAVPGAPSNVSGTVDHGRSLISWTPPASNGSPISNYTASVVGDPTLSCTYNVPESGPEVDQCLITGLADHTSYKFQVNAASGVEAGASTTSSLVTTAGVPDAPTDVIPTPGVARISVAWTDGASNGSPITSWTIRIYTAGPTLLASKTDCTGSPCVVSGLSNATNYTVDVSASNAVGTGAFSDVSAAVGTASIPDPPVVRSTSYGPGSITVAFGQPSNNGGTAIWTWTLYCKSPNGGAARGASTSSVSTTSLTATGLTPGKSYFCYLYDYNRVGQSALTRVVLSASPDAAPGFGRQTSTTFVPDATPSIVAGAKVIRGDGQATVSWGEPAPNGSSAVVNFSVVSTPSVTSSAGCTNVAEGLPKTCVFTGLTNGTSYTFSVVATNVMGSGTVRTVSRVVPAGLPGAPSITSIVPASKQCSVTWSDGAANGSPLLGARKVTWSLGSTLKGIRTVNTGSSLVITGLTDGLSYSFKVANANGVGSTTSPVVLCTPGVPAP